MVPQNNPPEFVATFDCTPDGSRTSQCGVVSHVNAQNQRSSHDVLFADDKSPQHSLRLLGSDLLSADFVKRCFLPGVDPVCYTPQGGYNIHQTVCFCRTRDKILHEPSQVLMITIPGFGTPQGGRHSCNTLRNLGQLVLAQLSDPNRHVIIDGAMGNPAWSHESFQEIVNHPRLSFDTNYFWCAAGVMVEGKLERRRSRVMSTFEMKALNSF